MNIPKEIAEKYNFLKKQTYDNLGLHYSPGVITYVAPPPSTIHDSSQFSTASKLQFSTQIFITDYTSTGGLKRSDQQQLFTQLEEILKSMSDHLSNMTKGIILEEDNSFIQESLSKKFLEPLNAKDQHFSQLPSQFLHRVDSIKGEFDSSIRKLVEHFSQQKEDLALQHDRKMEVLRQEATKYKLEVRGVKQQQERQCMCKYYEETLEKVKDDHLKYVDRLKKQYETEIYDIRAKNSSINLEAYRDKIFTDLHTRVISFVQERYGAYLNSYCHDHGLTVRQIDPVELLFYIASRLQADNNWLVDKLADLEDEKRRLLNRSELVETEQQMLTSSQFSDIVQQTMMSSQVLEQFNQAREQMMNSLADKENVPLKRHNYNTSASNLRESLQSNRSLGKSQSGLNIKYQNLMRSKDGSITNDANQDAYNSRDYETNERSQALGESADYYREYNK